jgi:hypothetical protein
MEHRNGSRAPIAIPVELWRGGKRYGCFLSGNISHGGLFLNCCGRLKKGDVLTAKIANASANANDNFSNHHQLKVMVVQTSDRGVGLMWADCNMPFFSQLEGMLSAVA